MWFVVRFFLSIWVQLITTKTVELLNWPSMSLEKILRLANFQPISDLCHLCLVAQEMYHR